MSVPLFIAAAVAEIAGCYVFFAWWRNGAASFWLVPGFLSLVAFAWLLALTPLDAAGRAYAAYGGIYIAAALIWLWAAEGIRPDRYDIAGAAICLVGAAVILLSPRGA